MCHGSQLSISGVASLEIWAGAKMFDFRRITLFYLEKRLSKHKMTIFSKNLVGAMAPLTPWLRLCFQLRSCKTSQIFVPFVCILCS